MVFSFDAGEGRALRAVTGELRGQHGLRIYEVVLPSERTAAAVRPADAASDPELDTVFDPCPYGMRPPAAAEICIRE
ncbi:MAG: hypothetical protein ABW003_30120 [Microvirga sp.]